MQGQSVIITHTFIPLSGIPMHPCLCSWSTNSSHFLQLPVSAPLRGLQQPLGARNWNRVHAFNSSWLVFKQLCFCFVFFLCVGRLQVALHACGIATDMVMEHCVQAGAAFVISPCCYGFIQNAVKFTFPKRLVSGCSGRRSGLFISSSLYFDLALLLGSCWLECFSFLGGGWAGCGWVGGGCLSRSLSLCLMRAHKHSLDVLSKLFSISFMRLITADSGVAVSHHIQKQGLPLSHSIWAHFSRCEKWRDVAFFFFFSHVVENSKLCCKSITFWLLEIIKANSHREKVKREALLQLLIPLP